MPLKHSLVILEDYTGSMTHQHYLLQNSLLKVVEARDIISVVQYICNFNKMEYYKKFVLILFLTYFIYTSVLFLDNAKNHPYLPHI